MGNGFNGWWLKIRQDESRPITVKHEQAKNVTFSRSCVV